MVNKNLKKDKEHIFQINNTQALTVSKQLFVNPSTCQIFLTLVIAPATYFLGFWTLNGKNIISHQALKTDLKLNLFRNEV